MHRKYQCNSKPEPFEVQTCPLNVGKTDEQENIPVNGITLATFASLSYKAERWHKLKAADIMEPYMKQFTAGIAILATCGVLLGGCAKSTNILGWAAPSGGSAAALMADGNAKFAGGDWTGASKSFKAAVSANPADSEARYNYVKACCKAAGLDLSTFLKDFSNSNGALTFNGNPFKFSPGYTMSGGDFMLIDSTTSMFGMSLSQLEPLIQLIIEYLDPIASGACDGVIPSNSVGLNLNLAFAHLLRGMFYVFDTGLDGTLNYNVMYKNSDGTIHIYPVNSSNIPSGAEIKAPTTVFDSTKAQAKSDLSSAIANLNVAISENADGSGGVLVSLRNELLNIQAKFSTL